MNFLIGGCGLGLWEDSEKEREAGRSDEKGQLGLGN
jgi:hypothetical protein